MWINLTGSVHVEDMNTYSQSPLSGGQIKPDPALEKYNNHRAYRSMTSGVGREKTLSLSRRSLKIY